jgi:hypothetical protein
MEAKERYNGYANYETWAVTLWLSNEEPTYRYWREAALEARAEAAECWQVKEQVWNEDRAPVFLLAGRLKEEVTDDAPELGCSLYSDLLNSALLEVHWHEVAETFLEIDEETSEGQIATSQELSEEPRIEASRFSLGRVVTTSNALHALEAEDVSAALVRHAGGDWGECSPDDWKENELSLQEGFRLFSVYRSAKGVKFWVITEADRSSTTVLLPDEY